MMWQQYVLVVLAFMFMDGVNFGLVARDLYASWYKDGFTNVRAALLVYLLYPWCVLYLTRGGDRQEVGRKAVVLGLAVYGIYHLTNMATMPQWSVAVAAYDTLWGGLVTVALAWLWHRLGNV